MSDAPRAPSAIPPSPPPAGQGGRKRSSGLRLRVLDRVTFGASASGALLMVLLLGLIVAVIAIGALPAIKSQGLAFLWGSRWSIRDREFGAWPYLYSTLVTSVVALVLAVPVSVGSALFLVKLAPQARPSLPARLLGCSTATGWIRLRIAPIIAVASFLIELLAAIPSIAYGLWGIAVLVPAMQNFIQPALASTLGNVPLIGFLFARPTIGFTLFTASVVLAIMIIPIVTAIVRDVLAAAPPELEQGALGLGATWWQSQKLVLGYSKLGIFGGVVLGFARAMGETMAITMLIGLSIPSSNSLFAQGQTIASLLANQFGNADTNVERQALLYTALILLVITLLINGFARALLLKVSTQKARKQ